VVKIYHLYLQTVLNPWRPLVKIYHLWMKTVRRDLGAANAAKEAPISADSVEVGAANAAPTNQDDNQDVQDSPPSLSIVDLNTGEIIPPPQKGIGTTTNQRGPCSKVNTARAMTRLLLSSDCAESDC